MNRLAVVEKFVSINGEGTHAGELAVFLRFRGCNLNCGFCDTKWANAADAPATEESAEELVEYVRQTGVQNVTLTGGEPLLQPHIGELITALGALGYRVEIETNGSVALEPFAALAFRHGICHEAGEFRPAAESGRSEIRGGQQKRPEPCTGSDPAVCPDGKMYRLFQSGVRGNRAGGNCGIP